MQVFWFVNAMVFGAVLGTPMNTPKSLDLSKRQVSRSTKIIALHILNKLTFYQCVSINFH
jgi:hypothetical protein